jgi:hypothetical protein
MAIYGGLNRLVLVKICPTCEFENLPTIPFCVQCCDSLVSVVPTESIVAANMPCEPSLGTEVRIVCPDCKTENGEGVVRCLYCDCVMC